jgi:hypothetical protein
MTMAPKPRTAFLSGFSGFFAPLVFVTVVVLRKVHRRVNAQARFWNKRLQNEIARWS